MRACRPRSVSIAANKPDVDLHEGGPQLDDVAEVRDAQSRVIDRHAHLGTEQADRGAECAVVSDADVLGHLEHKGAVRRPQETRQVSLPDHEARPDVEAEPCTGRQSDGGLDRGRQGRHVQLCFEARRPGVRKHEVGGQPSAKRVRASYPTWAPDGTSTIRWKTGRKAASSRAARGALERAA